MKYRKFCTGTYADRCGNFTSLHDKIGECHHGSIFALQEIKLSELREKLDDLAAKHVSSPVGVVT